MTPVVPTARRAPSRPLPAVTAAALASSAALILLAAVPAHAAVSLSTFEGQDAANAAQSLIGDYVSLTSATLEAGRDVQAGSVAGLDLGLPDGAVSGVALSTGSLRAADPAAAADVDFTGSALLGPNGKLTTTGDLGGGGSALLESSFGRTTYDAAELRLEVVPQGDTLTIVYQIGSEEYTDWAARDYTDAFGVYVDGRLCSTVDGLPVGVDTINADTRPALFVSNVTAGGEPGDRATEMNGFTVPLTCTAAVTPGQPVTVVAAVADTRDGQLDSTLLLAAGGIASVPGPVQPTTAPVVDDGGAAASPDPVPASDTASTGSGSTRPGSPLANTGVDGAALAAGAGIAAAAMGAGLAALVIARRRRARDGVSAP